ncbi:uncharacterized protein [Diabrotica undecimpunctata]|uniref:uncharacterized protein n=1 Tax=Diabrotica undecimpunctata TaxID=50387 RepID=UPI003B631D48
MVTLKIILIYAPTSTHTDEEMEEFYEHLTESMTYRNTTYTTIMGDFNAKMSKKLEENENCIGEFGHGVRNERGRGDLLVNYLENNKLFAMNSFFKKTPHGKWTWMSPDGNTKNEIDYILTNKQKEHFRRRHSNKLNLYWKRVHPEKLKENREQNQNKLRTAEELKLTDLNLDQLNKAITEELLKTSLEVAPEKSDKKSKLSAISLDMLQQRGSLLQENKRNTTEYKILNTEIRRHIKQDLERHQEERIEKIIKENRNLRSIKSHLGRNKIIEMENKQGVIEKSRTQISKITRLNNKFDAYQPVEQAGFRKGYSTTDHLHTLKILIEKTNEYNLSIYLEFVDYEKAFDSLELWAVEETLVNCRIDSRYRMLIHNIYQNTTMRIQLDRDLQTLLIRICRGVRQGDTISSKLFTLALEDIFKSVDWDNKGICINGKYLNHLRFAGTDSNNYGTTTNNDFRPRKNNS